jgi:hypothetical protein
MSVMGHVSDMLSWFDSFEKIPITREQFKTWLTAQSTFIKANGKVSPCPVIAKVIQTDGMLYMKRRPVQKDAILSFPDKADPMKWALEIDEEKEDIVQSINGGQLFIAPTIILKKMLCVKSGLDYTDSPFSVVLDDDTSQKLIDCTLVSFHWTDKPRPIAFK